jgi:choline dehydrogenase
MNFLWCPDAEWNNIADITGDESWRAESMRGHLMAIENASYVASGTPGHGFEGYLDVSMRDLFDTTSSLTPVPDIRKQSFSRN